MSQKQLNRSHILDRLVNVPSYTIAEAAEALGLSVRQVKRLKGAYKEKGIDALVHKNIGRSPSHAVPEDVRKQIVELKMSKLFEKANFMHFREILARDKYGIKISYSALYDILSSEGIKSPMTRRAAKKHRRRKRKAREGLLMQADASPFDWLNDGQMYEIHGGIDDATGKVTALYMCKNECLQGYFEVMRTTITNNGVPVSLYADRHAIFVSPKDGKLTEDEQLAGVTVNDTQFGRALKQLGITLIKARSAQAKGRIERLWGTLQSRLPIEFAMEGITTIDAANEFLKRYVDEYNSEFAVAPEDTESAYREVSPGLRIDNVLCSIAQRRFDNGGVFSYFNHTFKIVQDKRDRVLPVRGSIQVLVSPVFGIRASFAGVIYEVESYTAPEKSVKSKPAKEHKKRIPEDSHYYKYGHILWPKVTFEDKDSDILKMLERHFLWKMPA